MACFEKASPALREILLKLYRSEKPMEIDHHLYEFGSVEYHIQSAASDPHHIYLSISTPLLSQGVMVPYGLSHYSVEMVKGLCPEVVKIIEPTREGYQLTLRLNFSNIPQHKGVKIITEISTVQAVILSSQLKEMLQNVILQEKSQGMYKPIKLVYHPREPFYVIRQPKKITTVFPMRFKEDSDRIIATVFFQELMDVGSLEAWEKVPPCTWSPIPPPELRGETFEDLSTNGGFVSFDISSCHVEGRKLDKTVWSLLNFNAYVENHVKSTRGFIQRRMGTRLESLVKVLQKPITEDINTKKVKVLNAGCRHVRKLVSLSESRTIQQRCGNFAGKIRRIRCSIKIHGFGRFHRQWLRIPKFSKFSSARKYTKLD